MAAHIAVAHGTLAYVAFAEAGAGEVGAEHPDRGKCSIGLKEVDDVAVEGCADCSKLGEVFGSLMRM